MRDYQTGLTAERVRELFRYVKSTGLFIRRKQVVTYRGGAPAHMAAGTVAGSLHKDGYVYLAVNGRLYLAHRLAHLWVTGSWPSAEVDHHNGVRHDNRWRNLRPATTQQNRCNTLGQRSRKNPYPGVYEPAARPGRHVAQIKVNGRVIYLGVFDEPEIAYLTRCMAEHHFFGEFAGSKRPKHADV